MLGKGVCVHVCMRERERMREQERENIIESSFEG